VKLSRTREAPKLEKSLFDSMMRKASLASYAVGIFAIASSIASTVVSSMLGPIESAIASNTFNTQVLDQFNQAMNTILPFSFTVLAITLLLAIVFAHYNLAVARSYEVGSLKTAVVAYVLLELIAIPVLFAAYALIPVLAQIASNPGSAGALIGQFLGVIILIVVAAILALVFLVLFVVTLAMGLNGMKRETEIGTFGTAMWLAIVGIILSFFNGFIFAPLGVPFNVGDIILQISIILFGFGLSEAAKQGRIPRRLRDRIAAGQA
jgi:putative exporter of polyketide antibiotics